MTLHPEVMRRAQAELDAVIGRERIPTLADRPNLPYIEAIVKETLRWRPISALCEHHHCIFEDVLKLLLVSGSQNDESKVSFFYRRLK